LPMVPRVPAVNLANCGVRVEDVLDFSSVFSRLHCPSIGIYPRHLVGSAFSSYATRGSESRGFGTLGEFERSIVQAVNDVPAPGYVFAYWSAFDKITHQYGVSHWRTVQHFRRLDDALLRVYKALKGTGTLMLVSADHGLIDVPPENTHWLADSPELEATLSLPLSGEPRKPYCYVKPGREDEFLNEVEKLFGEHVQVFDRERILREGWFGRGVMNPQLPDRIGDYVLKFDDARVLRDLLPGERRHDFVAYHGSDSEEEMYVPLIVVEC
jgi:predicted AlkP superfamily pyrophosphatase or phosphodiesterase